MLRDAVRVLADERIAPRAAEIDRTAEFPWDVKELLASHDILGLPFPEAYGGLGGDLLTVCLAIEQISRVCATSGLILAVQELGALPLLLAGHATSRRQRWFPDLAAGQDADRVRPDGGRGGQRRGRRPDARPPRRRRLGHRRLEAVHQPGQRRRPRHRLRGRRTRPRTTPRHRRLTLLRRREGHGRLRRSSGSSTRWASAARRPPS